MNNTTTVQIQQGDVLLQRIDKIPDGVKKRDNRILQHGEHTGHAHRAVEDSVTLYEDASGNLFVHVEGDAPAHVTHEEHGAIELAPGYYRAGIVQEFDHFAEEAREVRD